MDSPLEWVVCNDIIATPHHLDLVHRMRNHVVHPTSDRWVGGAAVLMLVDQSNLSSMIHKVVERVQISNPIV